MRELNSVEVNAVSGAGFFTDISAALGSSLGSVIESFGKPGATNKGTVIGTNVGGMLDTIFAVGAVAADAISTAVSNIANLFKK